MLQAQNLAQEINSVFPLSDEVYKAISSVKREIFMPIGLGVHAYKLNALPIASNQWISSPLTVAKMSEALELDDVDSILEIGCGSGYQAAVLSQVVRRVFTIERISKLLNEAKTKFKQLKLNNIHTRLDDGQNGWRSYAPFERILFSASTRKVPKKLFEQLKDGGILVAPIESKNKQIITKFTKNGDDIIKEEIGECAFVPVLDGIDRG